MDKIIFHLDDSKNLRGGERQVLFLSEELKKLGIINYIVARKNSPLIIEAQKRKIPCFSLPYFWEWDIISAIILSLKIKKICRKFYIPILHSHTGHTSAVIFLTSLFIKSITIAHRRVAFKLSNNFLTKLKHKKADHIIAISNKIKNILIESGLNENKISIIYSSIDLDIYYNHKENLREEFKNKFNISKEQILIGSLLAFSSDKDPLNLINAAKYVINSYPDVHFIIGGEGELFNKAKEKIKELNIENNFHLYGYCQKNISFLKSLDIFILPSREEGLGSVLIEAMACSLPLIGTDAGGIPELIENEYNGFIVPKENPEELSQAIIKLIKNPELRKKFSKNSFEKSKKYSSLKMAEETLKVYEKTIKNFKFN